MGVHWRVPAIALLAVVGSTGVLAQRPGFDLELDEQTLDVLPEPPAAVTAEGARLIFGIAPVRTQGLLSDQLRAGIRSMLGSNGRARFVHLRAFVAGSGDSRRVQEVVSEVFQNRKRPLPSLSVIQVGALDHEGAQVMVEYVAEDRRPQNPAGVAFVTSGMLTAEEQSLDVLPLVDEAIGRIGGDVSRLGADVLRVTCYCSSLPDGEAVRRTMLDGFPGAEINAVQTRRSYGAGWVTCEAAARLPESAVAVAADDPGRVATIGPGRVTFTGAQLAFRSEDDDIRLAFERLGRVLEESGSSYEHVVKWNIYPLSLALAERIRVLGNEFVSESSPPLATTAEVEGLPSLDASFAVDLVAVE